MFTECRKSPDFGLRREQCFLKNMHFVHRPPRRPFPSSSSSSGGGSSGSSGGGGSLISIC